MISLLTINSDQVITEKKDQLIKIIEENSGLWASPSVVQSLQEMGLTFNVVDENIFDRVFVVPSTTAYRASSADSLIQDNFLKTVHHAGLQECFVQIHSAVERLAEQLIENSHLPGYTVTTQYLCNRKRIPIHLHKGQSPIDSGHELTFSIALNLKKRDSNCARIRFYNSHQSLDRIQENLWHSNDFIEVPLFEPVTMFLFSANTVPHTVLFNQDLIVWAVFNGARPKQTHCLDPLQKIQHFL